MTVVQAALLGLIQGITEFLPISSDGHLALGFKFIDRAYNLEFVVFLHFATLLAIFAYFWRDVAELASSLLPRNAHRTADRRLVLLIVVGTAISGVLAVILEPFIESLSESNTAIGLGFLFTTIVLVAGEGLATRARAAAQDKLAVGVHTAGEPEVEAAASELPLGRATLIGFMQGLAVLPGVSRSGSTIAAGLFAGLTREHAARFSFLLGIPIITLAAVKDGLDMIGGTANLPEPAALAAGFLIAGISGYAAIWGLLTVVKRHSLLWFAAYTGVLGTVILFLGLTGRG